MECAECGFDFSAPRTKKVKVEKEDIDVPRFFLNGAGIDIWNNEMLKYLSENDQVNFWKAASGKKFWPDRNRLMGCFLKLGCDSLETYKKNRWTEKLALRFYQKFYTSLYLKATEIMIDCLIKKNTCKTCYIRDYYTDPEFWKSHILDYFHYENTWKVKVYPRLE